MDIIQTSASKYAVKGDRKYEYYSSKLYLYKLYTILAIRRIKVTNIGIGKIIGILLQVKKKLYDNPLRSIEIYAKRRTKKIKNILIAMGSIIDRMNKGIFHMDLIIITMKYIPKFLMIILLIYEIKMGTLQNYYKYLSIIMIPIIYDNILRMLLSEIQCKKEKSVKNWNIYAGVKAIKLLETLILYKMLDAVILMVIAAAWVEILNAVLHEKQMIRITNIGKIQL